MPSKTTQYYLGRHNHKEFTSLLMYIAALEERLEKCDKAFKILKPLMKEENIRILGDTWTINQILYLTQEEYELLEELMPNDKN